MVKFSKNETKKEWIVERRKVKDFRWKSKYALLRLFKKYHDFECPERILIKYGTVGTVFQRLKMEKNSKIFKKVMWPGFSQLWFLYVTPSEACGWYFHKNAQTRCPFPIDVFGSQYILTKILQEFLNLGRTTWSLPTNYLQENGPTRALAGSKIFAKSSALATPDWLFSRPVV